MNEEKFDQWAILEEVWRPVVGYEAYYEVSNMGRVRRIGRAARHGKGHGGGVKVGRILKSFVLKDGYSRTQLWVEGKPINCLIHCLVAEAFIGQRLPGMEVNHKNLNRLDNVVTNLEYVTHSENNLHSYRNSKRKAPEMPRGEAHHNAKLTTEQVMEIKKTYQRRKIGFGITALARKFKVDHHTIRSIIIGETWKEVTCGK